MALFDALLPSDACLFVDYPVSVYHMEPKWLPGCFGGPCIPRIMLRSCHGMVSNEKGSL